MAHRHPGRRRSIPDHPGGQAVERSRHAGRGGPRPLQRRPRPEPPQGPRLHPEVRQRRRAHRGPQRRAQPHRLVTGVPGRWLRHVVRVGPTTPTRTPILATSTSRRSRKETPPDVQERCEDSARSQIVVIRGVKIALELVKAFALGGRPKTFADMVAACLRHELLDKKSRVCACEGGVTEGPSTIATMAASGSSSDAVQLFYPSSVPRSPSAVSTGSRAVQAAAWLKGRLAPGGLSR